MKEDTFSQAETGFILLLKNYFSGDIINENS